MSEAESKLDLDDLQVLRHGASIVGAYLNVFYRELRAAGVPRKLARQATFDQWVRVQTSDQTEALKAMQETMRQFMEGLGGGSSDD